MTAATKNRNTPTRAGLKRAHLVAATAECFAGTIAMMNATGFAQPAAAGTGLIALGVFSHYQDNTAGADGAETVEIERGYFHFANAAGAEAIAVTDIGLACYAVDDQTVGITNGTGSLSPVGIVDDVDDTGVWVHIDPTNGVNLA